MRYLIVFLVLAAVCPAKADTVDEMKSLKEDLKKNHQSQIKFAKEFVQLAASLAKLSPSATTAEIDQIQARFAEYKTLLESLAEQNQHLLAKQYKLQTSPEYIYWKAIRSDDRRPTKENIRALISAALSNWSKRAN